MIAALPNRLHNTNIYDVSYRLWDATWPKIEWIQQVGLWADFEMPTQVSPLRNSRITDRWCSIRPHGHGIVVFNWKFNIWSTFLHFHKMAIMIAILRCLSQVYTVRFHYYNYSWTRLPQHNRHFQWSVSHIVCLTWFCTLILPLQVKMYVHFIAIACDVQNSVLLL